MPNLNLNEDPRRRLKQQPLSPFKKPPITGGGSKMLPLMVFFSLVIFVGVIVYLLNQTGSIQLWGEKVNQKENVATIEPKTEILPSTTENQPDQNVSETKQQLEKSTPEKTEQKLVEPKNEQGQKEQKQITEVKKQPEKKEVLKLSQEKNNIKTTGYYSIFIGSFRDRKKAEQEAQRWSEAGFDAAVSVKPFNGGNGKWYRVHIGNFSDKEEARKLAMKLADSFEGGYWIDIVK